MKSLRVPCILLAVLASAYAKPEFDPIYSSHMVLQRGAPLPIFGTSDPSQEITVTFAGQSRKAVADAAGRWKVTLDAVPEGGPHVLTATSGGGKAKLDDILIGDVWIASGQSNMAWAVRQSRNGEEALQEPQPPQLRSCLIPFVTSAEQPVDSVEAKWFPISQTDDAKQISGVGYFFARALAEKTGVPIGLVSVAKGATAIDMWTRREVLAGDPEFSPHVDRWEQALKNYPEAIKIWEAETEQREAAYKKHVQERKAKGQRPAAPKRPPAGPGDFRATSGLWNSMIHPLTRLPIKGVIWYQGETGTQYAEQYAKLFPAMIRDWRAQWHCGDFPFLFVQIANHNAYKPKATEPGESLLAEMRESQAAALSVPNTGMVSAIDLGEDDDIHPRDKKSVGLRLANLALKKVYGVDVVAEGPRFESSRKLPDGVEITFANTAEGLKLRDGDKLPGFAVAGADRKFVWAEAVISGPSIVKVLRPEGMAKIESVRYNWLSNPPGNLMNSAGLPAEPFRTDSWPGLSAGKR